MKYLANVSTLEHDSERCTGCRKCVEVCPHQVFVMEEKKARIVDKDGCMECGACALNCDFGALRVDSGVGCASAIITSMITGGEPVCGCENGDKNGSCC